MKSSNLNIFFQHWEFADIFFKSFTLYELVIISVFYYNYIVDDETTVFGYFMCEETFLV